MATAMPNSIVELQKAADSIREGLKSVNEDIKKLTGRDPAEFRTPGSRRVLLKRNSYQQRDQGGPFPKRQLQDGGTRRWGRTVVASRIRPTDALKDEDSSGDDEAMPHKPAVQSSVVATDKTLLVETKPKVEDKATKLRNKRMFGLLLGTLQKFKDDDKVRSEREKKKEAIEKKLDEQAQQEKADIASQKKELFQARRQKQLELRKLEHKMQIAELKAEVDVHNKQIMKFIKLKSSPPLFYLPKIHSDKTEELLKASSEAIEELQKHRFKEMDLSDDEVEIKSEGNQTLLSTIIQKETETANADEYECRASNTGVSYTVNNVEIRTVRNGEHAEDIIDAELIKCESESVDEKLADNSERSPHYDERSSTEQGERRDPSEPLG